MSLCIEKRIQGPRVAARPEPRYLFEHWPEVARRLRAAKRLAVFLDFDGTLAALVRRPEQARMSEPTRRTLDRLARHPRIAINIISGRRRADVRGRVGLRGLSYLGLHGWERGDTPPRIGRLRKDLEEARALTEERIRDLRGVRIEDKGLSFVVHYRGASARAVERAARALRAVLKGFQSKLRQIDAAKSWEILPREAEGKGPTVRRILARLRSPVLPIYVGDDASDESAFALLRRGITVHVGAPDDTAARFFLPGPGGVTEFLKRLWDALEG